MSPRRATHKVDNPMRFKVLKKRCVTCPFSKNQTTVEDDSLVEIKAFLRRSGRPFVCHDAIGVRPRLPWLLRHRGQPGNRPGAHARGDRIHDPGGGCSYGKMPRPRPALVHGQSRRIPPGLLALSRTQPPLSRSARMMRGSHAAGAPTTLATAPATGRWPESRHNMPEFGREA